MKTVLQPIYTWGGGGGGGGAQIKWNKTGERCFDDLSGGTLAKFFARENGKGK